LTIALYTWGTPNGRKISIALDEMELTYTVHPIDIGKGEQFGEAFSRISPNHKIPAIVDANGPAGESISVFESGAILIYLAEKTGLFMPRNAVTRLQTLEWLMWQMGGFGPMLGQAHHFLRFAKQEVPYAIDRYSDEAQRLYGVLDARLSEHEYLVGEYTIADIAIFPWAARHEWHGVNLGKFPNVKRWYDSIAARPAVQSGMCVPFLN